MLLLAAMWGSVFLLMHLSVLEFGPLPTAAVRVSIAAVFLLPLVWLNGLLPELKRHWRRTFFVGLLNSGIPFACIAFALLHISTGFAAILNATGPMFGALIAWLWLKDKPSTSRILGLFVGFVGVAMLVWRAAGPGAIFKAGASDSGLGWAVLACLVACLCYSMAASYTKRYLTGIPPLVTAAGSQMGAMLGLAVPAAVLWPTRMPGSTAWLAVVVAGVVCSALAYIVFFRLIENAGPVRALSVTFLVPVVALFYGAVYLGEVITPWMLMCAAVIVCGTALSMGLLKIWR